MIFNAEGPSVFSGRNECARDLLHGVGGGRMGCAGMGRDLVIGLDEMFHLHVYAPCRGKRLALAPYLVKVWSKGNAE